MYHVIDAERVKRLGGVRIWNRRNGKAPFPTKYCGRPTILGNPFVVGQHGAQGECCYKYEQWLETGEDFGNKDATESRRLLVLALIPTLKRLNLECWCWPDKCHTESLARRANFKGV